MNNPKSVLLLLLLLLMGSLSVVAQNGDPQLAYSGAKGIYIWNVFEPGAAGSPAGNGGVRLRIERRETDSGDWRRLEETSMPVTAKELSERYGYYSRLAFDRLSLNSRSVDPCFQRLVKYHQWDSVAFYLLDPVLALAIGRMWVDTTAKQNTAYEYRITQLDNKGLALRTMNSNNIRYPDAVRFAHAEEIEHKGSASKTEMTWRLVGGKTAGKPAFFRVFRRGGADSDFREISVSKKVRGSRLRDTLYLSIKDDQVLAGEQYHYYIQPGDMFGNGGPASDTIALFAYDKRELLAPDRLQVENVTAAGEAGLQLSWHLPDPGLATTVEIYRSSDFQRDFQQIGQAAPEDTAYTDYGAAPGRVFYYYLKTVDRLGNKSQGSAKAYGLLQDSQPPAPPINVKSETMATGIRLQWKTEGRNIRGFYIYRGKGITDSLELVSALLPADMPAKGEESASEGEYSYTDTSVSLRLDGVGMYTYAIRQESVSHVLSPFSLRQYARPGINKSLRILPPAHVAASRNGNSILVFWEGAETFQEGITGYNIYRSRGTDTGYQLLNRQPLSISAGSYTDNTVDSFDNSIEVRYALQSIHISGQRSGLSEPFLVGARAIETPSPAGLGVFKQEKSAMLRWNGSIDPVISAYKVYRMEKGNGMPVLLATIDGIQNQYEDKTPGSGNTYFYYVIAIGRNRLESEASRVVAFVNE